MNINQPLEGRGLAIPFTKAADPDLTLTEDDIGMPFIRKIPDSVRNHFVACSGEFVGTVLFLYFALSGAQVANSIPSSAGLTVAQTGSNPQQLQYIALCFGFSLAVNAWVFFRISGGLFNPAVTFGMCLIGALPWFRGVLLFFTQILGGIVAAALVSCMFPGELNVRTTLGGGTSITQGLFIEMFLTAELVFCIFMLAAEKHKGTFIAPVELTGVYFTGGSLNPARSFGPAVVDRKFSEYHWIYWLGPTLGSIIAAGFYKFIKILEYETANPGQDTDHATKLKKRKELLLAAGINEADAHAVAVELTQQEAKGGPDGQIVANGQGEKDATTEGEGMYGTQFRGASSDVERQNSGAQDATREARPALGNTAGKYSFLGRAGAVRQPSVVGGERLNSPAMATHDEINAPFSQPVGMQEHLGGMVNDEPRSRFARTASGDA